MIYLRKILFFIGLVFCFIYFSIIYLMLVNKFMFDYFSLALMFFGIYLLIKAIMYSSDSSFLIGSNLFLDSLVSLSNIFPNNLLIFALILLLTSLIGYFCFDSTLMKFVFYCSLFLFFILFLLVLI